LAGLFSERAGIFDIGLEGKILAAAFMSAAVAYATGSVWVGLLAGIGASVVLSAIHGLASITLRGDQIISGVAINFLAAGLTVVVAQAWFGQGGRTPPLQSGGRFEPINFPGAIPSKEMADAGPAMQLYSELMSGHSLLVYVALLTVPLSWFVLYKTRFGLRLRAVGENPAAVDTAGISVVGMRYAAVVICGVLCGIAGAYIATALQANFTKDMSAGRGFIALAALIFAKWRPWYALGACLLFGFFFAVDNRFQNILLPAWSLSSVLLLTAFGLVAYVWRKELLDKIVLGGLGLGVAFVSALIVISAWSAGMSTQIKIPVVFIQSLPYILTVVVLAGFVGKAIPPRSGGVPYVKEK
jgi:simple sugar transport system permease protein